MVYSRLVGSAGRSVAVVAVEGRLENVFLGIMISIFVEDADMKSLDVVSGRTVLVLGLVVSTTVFSVGAISPDVRFLLDMVAIESIISDLSSREVLARDIIGVVIDVWSSSNSYDVVLIISLTGSNS